MAIVTSLVLSLCLSPTADFNSPGGCPSRSEWLAEQWEGPESVFTCELARRAAQAEAVEAGNGATHRFYCETDPHADPLPVEGTPPEPDEGPVDPCRTELCLYVRAAQPVSLRF